MTREPQAQPADSRAGVVGVVLAGGESRRLGRDKATLELEGESLVARAARRLAAAAELVVVADRGRRLVPGLPSVQDEPAPGPAGGILGAAVSYPDRALLVLACDLPAVPARLLVALADSRRGDWVVPRWERGLEPLCALYRPAALDALRALARRGVAAPHRLVQVEDLDIHYLEGTELARFGPPTELFFNLNSPADLERWKE